MNLLLDSMNNPAVWSVVQADGLTVSTAIAIAADPNEYQLKDDRTSLRITVSAAAAGHRLVRTLAAQDLSAIPEIRFWIRANRATASTTPESFFLRLRLGSAAAPAGNAANTWVRNIPVRQVNSWELVYVSLDDLPPAVRSAVTAIDFQCDPGDPAATFNLDSIMAVREELLSDIEAALVSAVHEKVLAPNNVKVPAVVHNPDGAVPAPPQVRIYLTEMRADESRNTQFARRDFTGQSFRQQLPVTGYSLIYELEGMAAEPETRSRIFDFLLIRFAPRDVLEVNNIAMPIEWQPRRPWRSLMALPERFRMRFLIRAWRSQGVTASPVTVPYGQINLPVDRQEARN
jgi:hypothetical protein